MWKNALVSPDATLAEAIRIIDQTGLQIALVTDREGRLLGTLTDGDVRRALLALQSLHEPVKQFMNRQPCCIDEHQSRDEAVCLMKSRRLRQIPVLDGRSRVVDLEIDNALFTPFQLDNWVVIMAGAPPESPDPIMSQTAAESRPQSPAGSNHREPQRAGFQAVLYICQLPGGYGDEAFWRRFPLGSQNRIPSGKPAPGNCRSPGPSARASHPASPAGERRYSNQHQL